MLCLSLLKVTPSWIPSLLGLVSSHMSDLLTTTKQLCKKYILIAKLGNKMCDKVTRDKCDVMKSRI